VIIPADGSDRPDTIEPIVSPIPETAYRCPVCGELVDVTHPEEILLHHEHVTHPNRFRFKPAA
jgi:hypothetical protein